MVTLDVSHLAYVLKRIIGLWYELINNDYNLSSILYRIRVNDSHVNNNVCSWLNCVKDKFNECSLSYIWYNQTYPISREHLLTLVESSLKTNIYRTGQVLLMNRQNV